MKLLTSIFTVALSFSALASSVETKSFIYDGSQNSAEIVLRGEKTHTEYRVEDIRTTCYRQEIAGYSTICTGGGYYGPGPWPHNRPYPGPYYPRPGGYPYPGQMNQCYQQPIYRQVAYSCVQTVRTPFEVKDYDVDARVIVDVTNVSSELTPGEKINVTLAGDSISFDAVGSKKFFIVKKKQDIRSSMNGSVKMIDGLLAIELVEAAPVLKAIKLTGISVKDSVLNLNLGPIESRENINFSLKIAKKKTLGSDTVLLDRSLSTDEVEVVSTATGSSAGVDVANLGVELSGGKFSLTAKATVKVDGTMMNASQFRDLLETSKTLIYTKR